MRSLRQRIVASLGEEAVDNKRRNSRWPNLRAPTPGEELYIVSGVYEVKEPLVLWKKVSLGEIRSRRRAIARLRVPNRAIVVIPNDVRLAPDTQAISVGYAKVRVSSAYVEKITDIDTGLGHARAYPCSIYAHAMTYVVGEKALPGSFSRAPMRCSTGIHAMLTYRAAERF